MSKNERLKEAMKHFVEGNEYHHAEVRLLAILMETKLVDAGGVILKNDDLTASFQKMNNQYVCQSINKVTTNSGSRSALEAL